MKFELEKVDSLTAEEILQRIKDMPKDTTEFWLHGILLTNQTCAEIGLVSILSVISVKVQHLVLSFNGLGRIKEIELARIFGAIPVSVESLNLMLNHFGNNLAAALPSLSKGITKLNLCGNNLGNKVIAILPRLTKTLTHLDLSKNDLQKLTLKEQLQFLTAFPTNIIFLNLCDNGGYNRIDDEISNYIKTLPVQMQALLNTSDKLSAYRLKLSAHRLINQVDQAFLHVDPWSIIGKEIIPDIEIDAIRLPLIIAALDQQYASKARLTCGLLLLGYIETTLEVNTEEATTSDNLDRIGEKRTLQAVAYLMKASKDLKLKDLTDILLWDTKTTTTFPSVKDALASFTSSPEIVKNYNIANSSAVTTGLFSNKANLRPANIEKKQMQDATINKEKLNGLEVTTHPAVTHPYQVNDDAPDLPCQHEANIASLQQ